MSWKSPCVYTHTYPHQQLHWCDMVIYHVW